MVIKFCNRCAFHEIKKGEEGEFSYCSRENCYSQFSKCLNKHALKLFLEKESKSEPKPTVHP